MISYLPLALTWLGGAFQQAFCPESQTVTNTFKKIGGDILVPKFHTTPSATVFIPAQTDIVPEQVFRTYNLSLQHDSDSDAGVFAESHPKEWGEESAAIHLPGPAKSIAVNGNETLLVVGYETNLIIYELPSRKHLQTVRELGGVSSVKFQPGHNRLLVRSMVLRANQSAGYSQTQFVTRLLDLDYELTKPFTDIDGFPPVVSRAASAAIEGILKEVEEKPKWELERLRSALQNALLTLALESELHSSPRFWEEDWTYGRTHATFSPDGSFLVCLAPKAAEIVAGSPPFRSQFQLDLEAMWVLPSPDSRLIASTTYDHEGTHKFSLWNATNGAPVHTLPISRSYSDILFSPNSQFLAAPCDDNRICVWHTESGELDHTLDIPPYRMMAISPDGKYLAIRHDDGFQLVDFQTGRVKLSWLLPRNSYPYIRQLQFNKHGILFWCLDPGTVFAYDMARNVKWQFTSKASGDHWQYPVADIVLTENGFISADTDGVVRIWTL